MRLYIMRHGETDANKNRILQGQKDNHLNEAGKIQAGEAGKIIKKIDFAVIYASPLVRAIETAELATGQKRENFKIDKRLAEISFGELEGYPINDAETTLKTFFTEPQNYLPPKNGESLEELSKRVWEFLEEIKGNYPKQNVLIVSHGAAIHAMLYKMTKISLEEFWKAKVGNCAILEVCDETGEYQVIKESDVKDKYYGDL